MRRLLLISLFTCTTMSLLATAPVGLAQADRQFESAKTGSMLSDDLTFLRRLYLDATGIPPSREQVQAFRNNASPQKHREEIDRVLASAAFTDRWTRFFEDLFQNHNPLFFPNPNFSNGMHTLIRDHVASNLGWDALATAVLTDNAKLSASKNASIFWLKETIEESLRWDVIDDQAAWISDTMLGIRAECISCHDGGRIYQVNKGLSKMSRADFWGMAAFLSSSYLYYPNEPGDDPEDFTYGAQVVDLDDPNFAMEGSIIYAFGGDEIYYNDPMFGDGQYHAVSNSGQGMRPPRQGGIVQPKYPFTGEGPQSGETRRQALARIITKDRQFARNMVNRIWAHFFNEGFVEPLNGWDLARVDPTTAAANDTTVQVRDRALLEYLTGQFIQSGYDMRALVRSILNSRVYQWEYLNTTPEQAAQSDLAWSYWRSNKRVRRLDAESISMSYYRALGLTPKFMVNGLPNRSFRSTWATPGSDTPNYEGIFDFQTGELADPVANGFENVDEMFFYLETAMQFNTELGRGNFAIGELRNPEITVQNSLFLMNDYATNIYLEDPFNLPTVAYWMQQLDNQTVTREAFVQAVFEDLLFRSPTPAEQQLILNQLQSMPTDQAVPNIFWALINHADFIHR